MKKISWGLGVLVLIGAAVLQLTGERKNLPGKGQHLSRVLPRELSGWRGREASLGPNEAASGAVEKVLRFDDVYFREFNSARGSINLYVAYWDPGAMPVQLVASHTPDRCWLENGWQIEAAKHGFTMKERESALMEGEWRTFVHSNQQRLNVLFWHLVGTRTYDFGDGLTRVPSIWRWWRDAAKQLFLEPEEQYFIRLSSNRPFEQLVGDPGWEELLQALAKLGLAEAATKSPDVRGQ